MSVSDWIIRGARVEPSALQVLAQNLDTWPKMILFIDELDKLGGRNDRSDYTLHQQVEVFSVLDRNVSPLGGNRGQWYPRHNEKLKSNVMMIGSGTWQDLWSGQTGRSIGFGLTEATHEGMVALIRKARVIPDELLNRFSDRWLIIPPYTASDFQLIASRLSLSPGDLDPEAAVTAGTNFRAVQNALTNRALRCHLARKGQAD